MAENPHHTGNEPYNFIMMFITNMFDEGLVVFPTHRLVHGLANFDLNDLLDHLNPYFGVQELNDKKQLKEFLALYPHSAFGLVAKDKLFGLHLAADLDHAIPESDAERNSNRSMWFCFIISSLAKCWAFRPKRKPCKRI
jgi:uncharacterized protein (DUF1015 family)